jgi:hypothetical protein
MAKKEHARSEAMLSRRKTGKTAIMHRLFKTIEYEVLRGGIKARWMEYLYYAFSEVNGHETDMSKRIVLYLCQN